MPDGSDGLAVRVVRRIADVPAAQWDACAGAGNPFVSHAFLSVLEDSGAATARTGWAAQHLLVEDGEGGVRACAPLYLKSHSYGEYVFDWSWADAYLRAGGRYYPKLQCAVPFTPVTGPRLLTRPGQERLRDLLAAGMVELAGALKVSSLHVTFPEEDEARRLGELGMLVRLGQQYHWLNRGYRDFEDFLAALASRRRKDIRKERERARQGLVIKALTGADIRPHHWDAMHAFYADTIGRKWAHAYLPRAFFHGLGERMADKALLILAERHGRPIAGALNLIGAEALYGRYWGAAEEAPFLHFELCYYQAIDFAIGRGLQRVEAGAQGEHKVARGYLPVPTWSAHWIADDGFRRVVARFLDQERALIRDDIAELAQGGPFRKG